MILPPRLSTVKRGMARHGIGAPAGATWPALSFGIGQVTDAPCFSFRLAGSETPRRDSMSRALTRRPIAL